MNWKILNDSIRAACILMIGIGGYGYAKDGHTEIAIYIVLFLIMILIGLSDERKIKKLENTILAQESILLRTEYIRKQMQEERV